MVAKMQYNGRDITGLHIGIRNVRRHFTEDVRCVELELDHLRIECDLKPGFWGDQPEITDPRLCAWLKAKNDGRESGRAPADVIMFPEGKRSFRLHVEPSVSDGGYPIPPVPAA